MKRDIAIMTTVVVAAMLLDHLHVPPAVWLSVLRWAGIVLGSLCMFGLITMALQKTFGGQVGAMATMGLIWVAIVAALMCGWGGCRCCSARSG